ncbi:MAG: hypothetical protein MZW92_54665 [Comamonadaceae bacterium]|nr:hypothetical protein [Comamonadaceae bacterium]
MLNAANEVAVAAFLDGTHRASPRSTASTPTPLERAAAPAAAPTPRSTTCWRSTRARAPTARGSWSLEAASR